MDEKDFELLLTLNKTKNISKAADLLFITQSTLSKRVMNIEKELDSKLLIRSHAGVHFTPAGEKVLEHVIRAQNELDELREDLNIFDTEVSGTLHAGVSINYAMYTLPDVLVSYNSKYPKVKLNIGTNQSRLLYLQMTEGDLDVAILRGEYQWSGPKFLLSQENICLIYHEKYKGVPLSDYMYINRSTDTENTFQFSRWMKEQGLSYPDSGFSMDNISTCVEMVSRGLGWALVPEIALSRFKGIVKPCLFKNGEAMTRRTYAVCQPEAIELPQVKAFLDEVIMP
ncbi:MAG: LysR family transcriptional regulator [Oribacterium sp.]|nr:LysR family transcriptional regulator [Oribacterium sp.]